MTSTGVWQDRTKSRDTVVHEIGAFWCTCWLRKSCTMAMVISGRHMVISGPQPFMLLS